MGGTWVGAIALFGYAAAFSFAYVVLPAGAGALMLFGAVQTKMVITGLIRGEHLSPGQRLRLTLAVGGLIVLVAPGVAAPAVGRSCHDPGGAGVCGRAYSLLGRRATIPSQSPPEILFEQSRRR